MTSKTPLYDKHNVELELLVDDNSKILTNSRGWRFLVDNDFEERYVSIRERNKYVECRVVNNNKGSSLGRFILNITDPLLECDHENRNSLDNRKVNLRVVPKRVNLHNRKYINARKFRGVSKHKNGHRVEICSFSRVYRMYLGSDYSEEQCGEIFDCIALKLNGADVQITNFDKSNYTENIINQTYEKFLPKIRLCPIQPSKQKHP